MEIELKNVGIIKSAQLEFINGLNIIVGSSSSGKSTLFRAIRSMMDNSFTDSAVTYGEKKLAIKINHDGHTATYIRDLENTNRKSAYQIDGKVFVKVGRSSLEDLSKLFKIAPIEIDGEKINFNFSAQFSGPFLLLGSSSLLYSILTYRSTFDITQLNDLYFTDLKKVKQDISVNQKTKETLQKEKEYKEEGLKKMEDFPSVYIQVQTLKQQYEYLQRQRSLISKYKETLSKQQECKDRLLKIGYILDRYIGYEDRLKQYRMLSSLVLMKSKKEESIENIKNITNLLNQFSSIPSLYKTYTTLQKYVSLNKKVTKNKDLLSKLVIPDVSTLSLLVNYCKVKNNMKEVKDNLSKFSIKISDIKEQILSVGVCPLCNQPLCNC